MKRVIIGFAAVALLAVVAVPAMASVVAGSSYVLNWPNGGPIGDEGPFYMNYVSGGVNPQAVDSFLTFCVEHNEYFQPGNTYKVDTLDTKSIRTNRGLSGYDAWLYTMFRDEDGWQLPVALTNSLLTLKQQDDVLQYAIWAGMVGNNSDYPSSGTPPSASSANIGNAKAEQQFGVVSSYLPAMNNVVALNGGALTDAILHTYGIGLYDFERSTWGVAAGYTDPYSYLGKVRALNLTGLDFPSAQDQLGFDYTLQGTPPVPEPMSLIVWSVLGMCGCVAMYRRWKRVG